MLNNLEVIINKLEYKVNELTLRNAKLKKLGVIKDRLNRDLAEIRYYSMKSSIENIKFEIEVLRSLLTWFSVELECLKLKVKRDSWLN